MDKSRSCDCRIFTRTALWKFRNNPKLDNKSLREAAAEVWKNAGFRNPIPENVVFGWFLGSERTRAVAQFTHPADYVPLKERETTQLVISVDIRVLYVCGWNEVQDSLLHELCHMILWRTGRNFEDSSIEFQTLAKRVGCTLEYEGPWLDAPGFGVWYNQLKADWEISQILGGVQ